MLRGVGDSEAGTPGQCFDAALTLREVLEEIEPMGVTETPRHQCQLLEQRQLRVLVDIATPAFIQLFS